MTDGQIFEAPFVILHLLLLLEPFNLALEKVNFLHLFALFHIVKGSLEHAPSHFQIGWDFPASHVRSHSQLAQDVRRRYKHALYNQRTYFSPSE